MDVIVYISYPPLAARPGRGYVGEDGEWVTGRPCPGCQHVDPANLLRPCCSQEALHRANHPEES